MLTILLWIVALIGFAWLWLWLRDIIDRQERRETLRRAFMTPAERDADIFEEWDSRQY